MLPHRALDPAFSTQLVRPSAVLGWLAIPLIVVVTLLVCFTPGGGRATGLGAAAALAAAPTKAPEPGPAPAAEPEPVDCRVQRCIALTFDDGPGPYTAQVLDDLREHGARATFFVIGSKISDGAILRRAVAEGHELGNHTFDHTRLVGLPAARISEEFRRTDDAVRRATGEAPTLVRPPFGVTGPLPNRIADRPVILWDVDTRDWLTRSTAATVRAAVAGAHPGAIILLHDIHPTSVAAVPAILTRLQERGFTLVTVSELLADPRPGLVYRNAG